MTIVVKAILDELRKAGLNASHLVFTDPSIISIYPSGHNEYHPLMPKITIKKGKVALCNNFDVNMARPDSFKMLIDAIKECQKHNLRPCTECRFWQEETHVS